MTAIRTKHDSPFYVTGGTLSRDALSYVTRQADHDLRAALARGKFCYVLTARQMGKSSLMVRTASRLRDEGVGVVVLDLTAIGQNLTAEQWYGGLLTQMANQLCLEDDLEEFWDSRESLGPLQRWMQAVRQVALPNYPGRLVVFIDEIDAVRSLPFSTDEFFAAIREFYNRRTEDAELERLSFCLLGVAAPSDLIRDTRMTPFNIGQRIELHDFTEEEARVLASGFGGSGEQGEAMLARILYWTSGHPYLTQRLCQAAADQDADSAAGVDRLCEELFFARRAREQDDNLLFVRERMLRSEVELAGLLSFYERALNGKEVEDDETNSFVTILKLSGITRIEDGGLRVRNRIYERVFDQSWIAQNMPDAELRRQRAAYRRGLLRAAAIAAVILLAMASLAFVAIGQRNLAREREETNRRQLYAAQMNLTARDWQDSSIEHMRELLSLQSPQPGQADLRGFEWYLLWALAHPERKTLPVSDDFLHIVFSPDVKMFASCTEAEAKLWDIGTNTQVTSLPTGGRLGILMFSPDGRLLATDSGDYSIRLWDVATDHELRRFIGHTDDITELQFSSDGKMLASSSADHTARLWEVATGNPLATLQGNVINIHSIAFSPDARKVVTAGDDLSVRLWDVSTGKHLMMLKEHPATRQSNMSSIDRVVFCPDGSRILATGRFMNVAAWDAVTGDALPALQGHRYYPTTIVFSPNGKLMATGSEDRTILLWDVGAWSVIKQLTGHGNRINELAFSPDSRTLASAGQDGTIKLWDMTATPNPLELTGAQYLSYSSDGRKLVSAYESRVNLWDTDTWEKINTVDARSPIMSLAYSADGAIVAVGTEDNRIGIWDVVGGKQRFALEGHTGEVWCVAFSPDGKLLASGGGIFDKTLRLWDVSSGKELAKLEEDEDAVTHVAFSPDGKLLARVGFDGNVTIREVATLQSVARFKGSLWMLGVVFSPDGKLLGTAAEDGTVAIWDIATRRQLSSLKGHAGKVFSPVFSPDAKRLVTAGQDFTVRVWDVMTGQELITLKRHTAPVLDVAFSPDGQVLVSAGRDGRLNVWRAATEQEVQAREAQ